MNYIFAITVQRRNAMPDREHIESLEEYEKLAAINNFAKLYTKGSYIMLSDSNLDYIEQLIFNGTIKAGVGESPISAALNALQYCVFSRTAEPAVESLCYQTEQAVATAERYGLTELLRNANITLADVQKHNPDINGENAAALLLWLIHSDIIAVKKVM